MGDGGQNIAVEWTHHIDGLLDVGHERGLEQKDLAKIFGVRPPVISQWKNGLPTHLAVLIWKPDGWASFA